MIILSIIIPVYNVHQYISQCLESIEQQKIDKNIYEVIIVNDGTPDDSMIIAEPIIKRMGNATIINQANLGLSAARNAGLEKAQGEYVWFVDSDDCLLENALQEVLSTIKSHNGVDVIASVLQTVDEKTGKTDLEYRAKYNVFSGKEYMFAENRCGASQRFIMRHKFLMENGLKFKKGIYHEDGDFGNRMLYLADTLVMLERPVYSYLLRSYGSIMSSRKMKMNYDLIDIYYGLEKFCDEKVAERDKLKFKMQIFSCLECTILFSRNEINTPEFKTFYREHKQIIHEKSWELLKYYKELTWKQIIRLLHFYLFPIFYTSLKHNTKILVVNIINLLSFRQKIVI